MLEIFLKVVFAMILGSACIVAMASFWQWFYSAATGQDETVYFRAADGWRLALHRYRPESTAQGWPVILCHGLSSNRYVFDMPQAHSLARFLRSRGRDVWVAELRGSGMSGSPGLRASDVPYSWDFEDHLYLDVPAIIAEVIGRTGAARVHWVGHSMGGMLILAHLAHVRTAGLASAVAVGSPIDFSRIRNPVFHRLERLRPLVRHCSVFPLPFIWRLAVPLAHLFPTGMIGLFHRPNIEPGVARRVLALASQLVTSMRLWDDFGRFVGTGVFANHGGRPYLEGLEKSEVPVLVAGGSKDIMAPQEAVNAACKGLADRVERACVVFGKESGCHQDYGHMDLILGKRCLGEVFPVVLEWLGRHDGEAPIGRV